MYRWVWVALSCLAIAALSPISAGAARAIEVNWTVAPDYETPPRSEGTAMTIADEAGEVRTMYSESHAVLIVQGDYSGSEWASAEEGARKSEALLRQKLEARGFHVMVWRDLTKAEFRDVLPEVFESYGLIQNSRFFFYYFGHATTLGSFEDPAGEQLYLVPTDAPGQQDEAAFVRKAVSAASLIGMAETMGVKHAFFAFEACKAGKLITTLSAPPKPNPQGYLLSGALQAPVRQYLTAGSDSQEIPADAAFSALLVSSLDSFKADVNDDGYITGSEVMNFVQASMPQYRDVREQNPEVGVTPRGSTGDLIFGPIDPMSPPAIGGTSAEVIRKSREIADRCLRLTADIYDMRDEYDGVYRYAIDVQKAEPICTEALRKNPTDTELMVSMGWIYRTAGRGRDAMGYFRQAADAGDPEGLNGLGVIAYWGLGEPRDRAKATEYMLQAAKAGAAPAMVDLGLRYRDGGSVEKSPEQAREWFERATAKGYSRGYTNLAWMLWRGLGGEVDMVRAEQLLKEAAAAGEPQAMRDLGQFNEEAERDTEATRYYAMAAEAGQIDAMVWIGDIYMVSEPDLAYQWLSKAAEQGRNDAKVKLGDLYFEYGYGADEGGEYDYAAGNNWYEEAASGGSGEAMSKLARSAIAGIDKPGDFDAGLKLYRRALDNGWSFDSNFYEFVDELGRMYEGRGEARKLLQFAADMGDRSAVVRLAYSYAGSVDPDPEKAKELYFKAAGWNDKQAISAIADAYLAGTFLPVDYDAALEWQVRYALLDESTYGLSYTGRDFMERSGTRDYIQARKWLERALELKDPTAAFSLAWLYQWGRGVDQDYVKAREYLELAIDGNWELGSAYMRLGLLCRDGQGGPQDYARARSLFDKAIEDGEKDAYAMIGGLYEKGQGVEVDIAKAKEWLQQGIDNDSSLAAYHMARIYAGGSDGDIDPVRRNALYLKAAEMGSYAAMEAISGYLLEGSAGEPDPVGARTWAQKAYDGGRTNVGWRLVKIYDEGLGTSRNSARAGGLFMELVESKQFPELTIMYRVAALSLETRQVIQLLLKNADRYDGPIDGDIGPKARAAIQAVLTAS
jgi:TPR repeat protein